MRRAIYALALILGAVVAASARDPWGGGSGGYSLAYLATQFCALTGCTMTGQRVSSGVAVDDTTGPNEDWVTGPNGSGTFEVAKTAQTSTAEVMQRWTLSDSNTTTKFFIRLGNVSATDATLAPDLRGYSNSTSTSLPGFQWLSVVPSTADTVSHVGIHLFTCATSTDGATGTLGVPAARPCVTFRANGTDRAHIGWGGAWINEAQTLTVADNGGGTAAAQTLNPSSGFHLCTCNDANGCTITVGESAIKTGQELKVACTTANACNFADTAGVTELAGAFACTTNDTLHLIHNGTAWVEIGRSDN